jgi:hypothetical protein
MEIVRKLQFLGKLVPNPLNERYELLRIRPVPCLKRLAAGLSPRRPGFDPGSVHVEFVVDKLALGQVFSPSTSVFSCQFHSTGVPLLGKG